MPPWRVSAMSRDLEQPRPMLLELLWMTASVAGCISFVKLQNFQEVGGRGGGGDLGEVCLGGPGL